MYMFIFLVKPNIFVFAYHWQLQKAYLCWSNVLKTIPWLPLQLSNLRRQLKTYIGDNKASAQTVVGDGVSRAFLQAMVALIGTACYICFCYVFLVFVVTSFSDAFIVFTEPVKRGVQMFASLVLQFPERYCGWFHTTGSMDTHSHTHTQH